jgi:hypothetical protein
MSTFLHGQASSSSYRRLKTLPCDRHFTSGKQGAYITDETLLFFASFSNTRRSQLQQVNHGDQKLNVQGKLTQVIFDSGSTYTYFPHEAYTNLVAAVSVSFSIHGITEQVNYSVFLTFSCNLTAEGCIPEICTR